MEVQTTCSVHTTCKYLQEQTNATDEGLHRRAEFEAEFAASHIETNPFQKLLLAAGSAAVSLIDPTRADMIAVMGETAGTSAIRYMLKKMEASPEGQEILRKRPRINSRTVDLEKLKELPDGTLGHAYIKFLEVNNVTPDSRLQVQFVDDVELAYVIQRYREVHDLFHTVLNMPTNMLGEVTVKWVEAIQTRLPMCVGGALFGALRLAPKQRQKYVQYYLPWAIRTGTTGSFLMNVFFEQRWDQPVRELLRELNITPLEIPKS
ncbi:ubiquinone biosynthesis protein COQ4 homolog, mitochondrial isoform X2 [Anabrus simplex]|uniref:ubiquinone biosynthesis protein COQ4 homolog, mitochondrial isoform X2 n=1 Tax=Anabrus simplex TaxID=316456 RepID=UPI0034DD1FA6